MTTPFVPPTKFPAEYTTRGGGHVVLVGLRRDRPVPLYIGHFFGGALGMWREDGAYDTECHEPRPESRYDLIGAPIEPPPKREAWVVVWNHGTLHSDNEESARDGIERHIAKGARYGIAKVEIELTETR